MTNLGVHWLNPLYGEKIKADLSMTLKEPQVRKAPPSKRPLIIIHAAIGMVCRVALIVVIVFASVEAWYGSFSTTMISLGMAFILKIAELLVQTQLKGLTPAERQLAACLQQTNKATFKILFKRFPWFFAGCLASLALGLFFSF